MYYVYILRCKDKSLYTGITNDLERRIEEHFTKSEKCAKYTKSHTAEKLEIAWKTENKVLASKLEYAIKTLKKGEKEELISRKKELDYFFEERLECEKYEKLK